jgi:hypothetical protein
MIPRGTTTRHHHDTIMDPKGTIALMVRVEVEVEVVIEGNEGTHVHDHHQLMISRRRGATDMHMYMANVIHHDDHHHHDQDRVHEVIHMDERRERKANILKRRRRKRRKRMDPKSTNRSRSIRARNTRIDHDHHLRRHQFQCMMICHH